MNGQAVSVVIPTYNRAALLEEAVETVWLQDYEPLEIVIVDDGSTDETPSVVKKLQARSPCPLIAISQPNQGESAARNAGIKAASHDLLAFLDSDNRWLQDKLKNQIPFMVDQGYQFTFTAYRELSPDLVSTRDVSLSDWKEDAVSALRRLLIGCVVNTSTVVARREVLVKAGLFDLSLRCCADHDMWLKIAASGERFGYMDVPLLDYRVHDGSVSQQADLVAISSELVYERLFKDVPLPQEIYDERTRHLSRCYLNSACRYLEAGEAGKVGRALVRAARYKPSAVRPGWLRLLFTALREHMSR